MGLLWTFCLAVELFVAPAMAADVVFRKETLTIGKEKLTVEVAETPSQQERGLMYREKLGEDEGMIFIFEREETLSFWMKNTYVDLAIGYYDKNKKLIDVQEMKATSPMERRPPNYPSKKPAMYALEVRKGWFERKGIKLGSTFVLGETKKSEPSRPKSSH